MIVRIAKRDRYTTISNEALRDHALSFKARGILAYLLSHADGWEVRLADLIHASDSEGRDSIRSGLTELEAAGYLRRDTERDSDTGQIIAHHTYVYESCTSEPQTDNPSVVGPAETPQTPRSEPGSGFPTSENPPLRSTEGKEEDQEQDLRPSSSLASPRERASPESRTLCDALSLYLTDLGVKHSISVEWYKAADRLVRLDQRPLDEALDVLEWTMRDDFWSGNIHSMPTFRKQYDKLRLRSIRGPTGSPLDQAAAWAIGQGVNGERVRSGRPGDEATRSLPG